MRPVSQPGELVPYPCASIPSVLRLKNWPADMAARPQSEVNEARGPAPWSTTVSRFSLLPVFDSGSQGHALISFGIYERIKK